MRGRLVTLALAAPLALWLALPLASGHAPSATASEAHQIQRKIDATRAKIGQRKRTEGVLTTDISGYSARIGRLQGSITRLTRRQRSIQTRLEAERSQLLRIQDQLRSERARLARLQARLLVARRALAGRLRELYKTGETDVITVVLESHDFAELLENGEFLRRVNEQDARIVRAVAGAKLRTERVARRLDRLENRQRAVTAAILSERNQVASVRGRLNSARAGYARARTGRRAALGRVRGSRHALQEDLASLEREQSRIQSRLQGAPSPGPIRGGGNGRWVWPVNGTITSPFCERRAWEACHPGMDIAVAAGTPIRAADGGRVAIAGWVGGYGNYTCIQHSPSLSSCYGHQSEIDVHIGQAVGQGQVIGRVGSTGHSTGPHLHFEARVNGSVVNPLGYL